MSEPGEFPQSSPTPPPLPRRGIAQPWSNEILGRLQQSDKPEPDTHRPQPGPHRAPQNMEPQTTRRAFTDPQTTRRIVKDEQTTRVMPQGAVPAQNPLPLHPPQTVATPPLAQTTPPLAQATPTRCAVIASTSTCLDVMRFPGGAGSSRGSPGSSAATTRPPEWRVPQPAPSGPSPPAGG